MNKDRNNRIKYDDKKIVIFTHPEIDTYIGIPIEKSNNIREILKNHKENPSQKSEEEIIGNVFLYNQQDGYYESSSNNIRKFKIIELIPEWIRTSK
jgi:hypothetical protein